MELGPAVCDRLAYADDVDLMAETFEEVEEKVRGFKAAAEKVGLRINETKTKLMKVGRGPEFVEERVECGGVPVETVDKFKYLGSILTNRNEIEIEIAARIACGNRARWALGDIFRRGWLSRTAKLEVYSKVILPTVVYGCETGV